MAQSTITVRMDEDLKRSFDAVCTELGLSMSSAVTLLARQMTREQRLPFDVTLRPNRETLQAFRELDSGGGMRFSGTTGELMDNLLKD